MEKYERNQQKRKDKEELVFSYDYLKGTLELQSCTEQKRFVMEKTSDYWLGIWQSTQYVLFNRVVSEQKCNCFNFHCINQIYPSFFEKDIWYF